MWPQIVRGQFIFLPQFNDLEINYMLWNCQPKQVGQVRGPKMQDSDTKASADNKLPTRYKLGRPALKYIILKGNI
jgi:hypothetical protein